MKKVLHLLSSNKYSGAENVACNIINMFNGEMNMVYCSPNGPIKESIEKRNITFLPLKKLAIKEVKSIIKEFKPDIIYAHDFKASCIAALLCGNIRVISHIHSNNSIVSKPNLKSIFYKLSTKKFSKIVWVSQSAFDECYFSKKIASKSIVLYNVIPSSEIIEKSRQSNIKDKYDLIFLGRLAYPKNPERLIEIIKIIKQGKKDIKLAIVGDGEKRNILENMVKNYNLNDNVHFFGFQSNPFPIMKKSKLMIMTSLYEGTPMSALEAQCLGLPIISTPVDGLKYVIIDGYNGFLCDNNKLISKKIVHILDNVKEYNLMKKNSLKRFDEINDLNKYKNTIKKMLE